MCAAKLSVPSVPSPCEVEEGEGGGDISICSTLLPSVPAPPSLSLSVSVSVSVFNALSLPVTPCTPIPISASSPRIFFCPGVSKKHLHLFLNAALRLRTRSLSRSCPPHTDSVVPVCGVRTRTVLFPICSTSPLNVPKLSAMRSKGLCRNERKWRGEAAERCMRNISSSFTASTCTHALA